MDDDYEDDFVPNNNATGLKVDYTSKQTVLSTNSEPMKGKVKKAEDKKKKEEFGKSFEERNSIISDNERSVEDMNLSREKSHGGEI
jgi:hypothetical protein